MIIHHLNRKIKHLIKDKKGDGILLFIIFLVLLFGIIFVNYANITTTSIMRQKIYNAVQDGLTLARSQALQHNNGIFIFDKTTAENLIKKSLKDNNLQVKELKTWYSGERIYAKGRTTEGTPFNHSISAYWNFD